MEQKDIFESIRDVKKSLQKADKNIPKVEERSIDRAEIKEAVKLFRHVVFGNYFGAVKSFVKMQDEYDCMFFIADWHSLTTHPTPENIRNSVKTILSEYLACGIDPEKAPIYVQSDVKQVLELYLYLNMIG